MAHLRKPPPASQVRLTKWAIDQNRAAIVWIELPDNLREQFTEAVRSNLCAALDVRAIDVTTADKSCIWLYSDGDLYEAVQRLLDWFYIAERALPTGPIAK